MDPEVDVDSKVGQAVWWCAGLLAVLVIVAVLSLLKLGEIADAVGA